LAIAAEASERYSGVSSRPLQFARVGGRQRLGEQGINPSSGCGVARCFWAIISQLLSVTKTNSSLLQPHLIHFFGSLGSFPIREAFAGAISSCP
jgi:hypothetical protein